MRRGARGAGPVLDLGAGTGLVAERLAARGIGPVDGVDISPEMLARARAKGCYRALHEGDATSGLDLPAAGCAGLVSAGTFTLGHLGPEVLPGLLRHVRRGGVGPCSALGGGPSASASRL